jgi:hypothetical protein
MRYVAFTYGCASPKSGNVGFEYGTQFLPCKVVYGDV